MAGMQYKAVQTGAKLAALGLNPVEFEVTALLGKEDPITAEYARILVELINKTCPKSLVLAISITDMSREALLQATSWLAENKAW